MTPEKVAPALPVGMRFGGKSGRFHINRKASIHTEKNFWNGTMAQ